MTNKDLIKQYVNTGAAMSEHQLSQLNDNLLTTYFRRRMNTMHLTVYGSDFPALEDHEYAYIPDSFVETFYKYFITQRIIKYNYRMFEDELEMMPERMYDFYFKLRIKELNNSGVLSGHELSLIPENLRYEYFSTLVDICVEKKLSLGQPNFARLPEPLKYKYLKARVENTDFTSTTALWSYELNELPPDLKQLYQDKESQQ
jgi:hypothetical protein